MSGQSSLLLLARTIVAGVLALHSRDRSRVRDDGILEEWRNYAPAQRRAAAGGCRRPHLAGLVSKRTCRGSERAAGGTVERERVQLVAAGGAHSGLARATRRGGRGLRGRVRGPGACDRRSARRVERGPLADEAPRSARVCAGTPVPPAGLAPNPAGLESRVRDQRRTRSCQESAAGAAAPSRTRPRSPGVTRARRALGRPSPACR